MPGGRHADRRDERDARVAPAGPALHVGRVEPHVGVLALDRPGPERLGLLVQTGAQRRHLGAGQRRDAELLGHEPDLAGAHARDVHLAHERDHGRLDARVALEYALGEVGPLAQLGDPQLEVSEGGRQGPLAVAVPAVDAPGDLEPRGAPQASCAWESIRALTTDWITSLPNSLRSSHSENSASRASVWVRSRASPRSGWDRMSLWAIVFPFVEYLGTDDSRRWPSLASYTTTPRATLSSFGCPKIPARLAPGDTLCRMWRLPNVGAVLAMPRLRRPGRSGCRGARRASGR